MTQAHVDRILKKLAAGADYEVVEKETELATLRREVSKIEDFIQRSYADKLEGKISEDFWLQQTRRW